MIYIVDDNLRAEVKNLVDRVLAYEEIGVGKSFMLTSGDRLVPLEYKVYSTVPWNLISFYETENNQPIPADTIEVLKKLIPESGIIVTLFYNPDCKDEITSYTYSYDLNEPANLNDFNSRLNITRHPIKAFDETAEPAGFDFDKGELDKVLSSPNQEITLPINDAPDPFVERRDTALMSLREDGQYLIEISRTFSSRNEALKYLIKTTR